MSDLKILERERQRVDELLEYKRGKRTRAQVDSFILRMMAKARETEKRKWV